MRVQAGGANRTGPKAFQWTLKAPSAPASAWRVDGSGRTKLRTGARIRLIVNCFWARGLGGGYVGGRICGIDSKPPRFYSIRIRFLSSPKENRHFIKEGDSPIVEEITDTHFPLTGYSESGCLKFPGGASRFFLGVGDRAQVTLFAGGGRRWG